jgi:hypothetical protein
VPAQLDVVGAGLADQTHDLEVGAFAHLEAAGAGAEVLVHPAVGRMEQAQEKGGD